MLDELLACIEQVKTRMEDYNQTLQTNEWRTRMQLIDPLLQVLGWDVSDPNVVIPEYDIAGDAVDYALLDTKGKPVAVIEAKKLGTVLSEKKIQKQIVGYAGLGPTQRVGLTDGNYWYVYDFTRQGELKDKQILNISISTDPSLAAIKLLLLWRPILSGGFLTETTVALEQVEQVVNKPKLTPPKPVKPEKWVSVADYDLPAGSLPPASIKFLDDDVWHIQNWYEVLSFSVDKLYRDSLITSNDLPIYIGPKVIAVNSEPVHLDGKAFIRFSEVGNSQLYVNTNLNAAQVRYRTGKILTKFGIDPGEVYLNVG